MNIAYFPKTSPHISHLTSLHDKHVGIIENGEVSNMMLTLSFKELNPLDL